MRRWILPMAAVVMLAAVLIIHFLPEPPPEYEHRHDQSGFMLLMELDDVKTVEIAPLDGEPFTITARGGGFWLGDGCDPETVALTAYCASAVPYYKSMTRSSSPLMDYGLDPPRVTVTVNGDITFGVGGQTLDGGAYYCLKNEIIYIVDCEVAEQLLLPKSAYKLRDLWQGPAGDRPALTEITLEGRYTIVRNELDDDAPLGLSRYALTEPFKHVCNDDAVRVRVLDGINGIDLDEVAEGVTLDRDVCHALRLKAGGFDRTLYIGGVAPDGGRYLMLDGGGTVYIDWYGDYGFLDVTPLDLTYGLAFWLHRFDDVEAVTVTDGERVRTLPEDVSEMNLRRFFAHALNFSISGMAEDYGEFDRAITFYMTDGRARELRFARENERHLAVSVDGEPPLFTCNVRDWQQIIEDLDNLDAGRGIRET